MAEERTSTYPELSLGPLDPDNASDLTARLGVHGSSQRLLQSHAANYPQALITLLSRPIDGDRSQLIVEHPELLEEVEEAARAVRGRRRFLDSDDKVLSATVRGGDRDRILTLTYEKPSGRTARGALDYRAAPGIEDLFQEVLAGREGRAAQAERVVVGDDEAQEAIRAAEDEAEERVRAAQDSERETLAEMTELRERLERLENPEPFDGYDDLNVEDVASRIKEGGAREFGLSGLDRIRDYEESRERPRKGVLEAVEDARAAAPQPETPDEE